MVGKRASTIVLLSTALVASPVLAGVVYEIDVIDHGQSPAKHETIETAVEGAKLKMGIAAGATGGQGEMIFRGDRREMVVVDHDNRAFHVMDEATMQEIAGQVSQAMRQVQEMLKNVPEDQRRMVEEMMKKRMPQQVQTPEPPKTELRKTGDHGDRNGYPCVKYEVLRDDRKVREMWVTDWSNVEGGKDVANTFEDMADFFQELLDSLPDFGRGDTVDLAFAHLREIGGFPVVTREFGDDGSLEGESALRSASRRTLDPAEFEPPAGYKQRSMGRQ